MIFVICELFANKIIWNYICYHSTFAANKLQKAMIRKIFVLLSLISCTTVSSQTTGDDGIGIEPDAPYFLQEIELSIVEGNQNSTVKRAPRMIPRVYMGDTFLVIYCPNNTEMVLLQILNKDEQLIFEANYLVANYYTVHLPASIISLMAHLYIGIGEVMYYAEP